MSLDVEKYVLYKILNTPLRRYPFPHIYVEEVFPDHFYTRLLDHFPPSETLPRITDVRPVRGKVYENRLVLPMLPEHISGLPEVYRSFWSETVPWLLGETFGRGVLSKFMDFIEKRFKAARTMTFYPESLLVEDHVNYSLGPHTDAPSKVISLLFYLPYDASKSYLGTSIYIPHDPTFTCPGGPHHDPAKFKAIMTMPYRPNTLFGFAKTDNSFHGVESITEPDICRRLLLYDLKHAETAPGDAGGASAKQVWDITKIPVPGGGLR